MKTILPFLFFGTLLLLTHCSSQQEFGTKYIPQGEKTYPAQSSCEIRMVVNLPEEESNYELIGKCKVRKSSRKRIMGEEVINRAAKGLEKCACENGGDIVKIVTHEQNVGRLSNQRSRQDAKTKNHYDDYLEGDVYRKITR